VAADGAHFARVLHAQAPTRNVQLVDALIAQIAVAVIPEPVPVVMEAVPCEGVLRRRAQPEVIVHARGHGFHRRSADRIAPLEAQASCHVDVADQALANLPHPLLQRYRRTALTALLDDAVILARRRHNLLRLEHVV